jgi:hypothetical protein
VKKLTVLVALLALPAAAKVSRPEVRPRIRIAPAATLADMDVSLKPARPQRLHLDQLAPMIDGVTVLELDREGAHAPRKVVLKPEFIGGPGATFALSF